MSNSPVLLAHANLVFGFWFLVCLGIQVLAFFMDIVWCSLYGPDSSEGASAFAFVMAVFCLFLQCPLLFFLYSELEKKNFPFSPFLLLHLDHLFDDEYRQAENTGLGSNLCCFSYVQGGNDEDGNRYSTLDDQGRDEHQKLVTDPSSSSPTHHQQHSTPIVQGSNGGDYAYTNTMANQQDL